MPVYEYHCPTCERRFEKLGSISDRDERTACPACGQPGAERLISVFAAFAPGDGQAAGSSSGCCGGGGGCACRG